MHWWLLLELAQQRTKQELADAEAARRARLAEKTRQRKRSGRSAAAAVWGAAREAAYALARAVR